MWDDMRAAFSFLTILPLGYAEGRKAGWSFAYFPLVGLCIGLILSALMLHSPFSGQVTSFLILLAWVMFTGGLHLDGFGDSCDALLATVTPERRLEIMKDPRTGSWAVIGLILLLLGKWIFIQGVSPLLLILPPVMGRLAMVLAAYGFPYARKSGLGAFFRDGLGRRQVFIASSIALIILLELGQVNLLGITLGLTYLFCTWAARRLGGGITGDVYGAICELTELLCLLVLAS